MAENQSTRLCSVDGCGRPSRSKGMCNVHYLRVLNSGTPHIYCNDCGEQLPVDASGRMKTCDDCRNRAHCKVDGCLDLIKRHGFCYAHYMKDWRYGTPTPVHTPWLKDLSGARYGTLTVDRFEDGKWICECDCGRTRLVTAGELKRTGERNTCGDRSVHRRGNDAGYGAAHQRVYRDRGKATDYDCADCGEQAKQWSYNHDDQNEKFDESMGLKYSLDPAHYSPRCVPCHKSFDLSLIRDARTFTPIEGVSTLF